jgi:acyl-CoA thioester hydrolase
MKRKRRHAFHETRLRVRYAETDQMGVVYYANHLIWFEVGRVELMREMGFSYRDLEREDGRFIAVAEATCRYRAPVYYDEEVVLVCVSRGDAEIISRIFCLIEAATSHGEHS